MKNKDCTKCCYRELYYIHYSLNMDLFTALYSTIIRDEDRVADMKNLIKGYFLEINNKNIRKCNKYECKNCKYRDRIIKTKDIYPGMNKVLSSKDILEDDKYLKINMLYDEYFDRTGPFIDQKQ